MKTKILISLVAVLFVSVLYLLYLNFTKKPEIINDWPILPTFTPSPIPTDIVTDSTANWKTYNHSSFGYSIQYPNNVSIKDEMDDQNNRTVTFVGTNINISITLQKTSTGFSLENYYFMDSLKTKTALLSGQKANIYEFPDGYCDGPGCSDPYMAIVTEYNGNIYSLSFFGDTKLSSQESQILSTFKFTQ